MTSGTIFPLIVILCISAMCFKAIFRFKRLEDWIEDRIFRRKAAKGTEVEATTLAKLGIENLPGHMDFIAGYGKEKSATPDLTDNVLRPTMGLRFISLSLSAVVLYLAWFGDPMLTGGNFWVRLGLTVLVTHAALHIQMYELRYDNIRFTHLNWFYQTKEYDWRDVISIKDNGHYQYVLRTEKRKKVEVQKYLVGINGFVAYANQRIAHNKMT